MFIYDLGEAIARHKSLLHLDVSDTGLVRAETKVIAEKLERNSVLMGIHLHGNAGHVYCNSRGFLCVNRAAQPFGEKDAEYDDDLGVAPSNNLEVDAAGEAVALTLPEAA